MSRTQTFQPQSQLTLTTLNTGYQLTSVSTFAKSVCVQSDPSNTDYVKVGNSATRNLVIAPGQMIELECDALDLGGAGKLDISTVWAESPSNSQKVNWAYLGGI